MKEKLIQLLMCPGDYNGSATCRDCPCRGSSNCVKALKVLVIRTLQSSTRGSVPYDLEARVTALIHDIGIPAHLKGHDFIRSAIMRVYEKPTLAHYLTSEIYPVIAEEYNTTASCVERNIRRAIEEAWVRGDLDYLKELFGNTTTTSRGKPSNGEFIALIADKLKLEIK